MSASTDHAPIVIIGAGQAAASAARALRAAGHTGEVMLFGEEAHLPYERPPLSKEALLATAPRAAPLIDAEAAQKLDLDIRTRRRVHAIDAVRREVVLDDGQRQSYRACLIATGGTPRTLPGLPSGTSGVHVLRTLDDALRLRVALETSERLLIIGGGFLGLEVASTARTLGREVIVLECGAALLTRALPPVLSDWLADHARAHGVDLRLGIEIEQVAAAPDGITVALRNGPTLKNRDVLVAIGITPSTALAEQAGLALDPRNGGIVVDAHGKTSADGLYAAGDCSSRPDPRTGQHQRLESWQNANEQGRCAAQALLGLPVEPLAEPWFWTDMFGCNVQIMGQYAPDLNYVLRGALSDDSTVPKALAFGLRNGELVHLVAINAGGDLRPFRKLVGQVLHCTDEQLADTALPVKQLARQAAGLAHA